MFFTNLETDRLILKNIGKEDREFVYEQFSDKIVTEYLFDEEPLTDITGADEIVNFYIKPEPRNQHRWIIIRKADKTKIGTCGFHCWDRESGKVDIGYDLKKEFWSNGFMHEALNEIIEFAKNRMNIVEINVCIYIKNSRSIKLVEKNKFIKNGTKNEIFRDNEYLHNIYTKRFEV